MKKILIPLITLILFIPCIVNAETCENDKVYIDSISLDKNTNVNEIEEATANGKNIDLNLGMSEVGDNIRYKIIVKNDSTEDYVLDKNSINISSKYIDYTIESDNNNVVKAKSSKTIYLRVNYSHQVPADAFEGGIVNDDINMKVNLSTNDNILNPNTGIKYILFISLIVLVMISLLIIFKKKRLSKVMIFIIGLSMFIPISAYALCRCDISINSNVFISDKSFTGTIYRVSEEYAPEGNPISRTPGWFIVNNNYQNMDMLFFLTQKQCNDEIQSAISEGYINEGEYYCKKGISNGVGQHKTNPSDINYNFYIKNEVTKGMITKAEVCFVTDKEICLSEGPGSYDENVNKLREEEEWFNNNGGRCVFTDNSSNCLLNNDLYVDVSLDGYNVFAGLFRGIKCHKTHCTIPAL